MNEIYFEKSIGFLSETVPILNLSPSLESLSLSKFNTRSLPLRHSLCLVGNNNIIDIRNKHKTDESECVRKLSEQSAFQYRFSGYTSRNKHMYTSLKYHWKADTSIKNNIMRITMSSNNNHHNDSRTTAFTSTTLLHLQLSLLL